MKDRAEVALVDLPAFGRPAVLVWHKRRWRCLDADRAAATWTEQAGGTVARWVATAARSRKLLEAV